MGVTQVVVYTVDSGGFVPFIEEYEHELVGELIVKEDAMELSDNVDE
jgi:hypothetical protein